jgi:hypothetical protein
MDSKQTYARDDLLDAWIAAQGSRDSHPDIADYYYRQAWALARAFGGWGPEINYNDCPKEHRQLWTVFTRTLTYTNEVYAPWGYFLSGGPEPERAAVEARHGPAIEAAITELRTAYRQLLLDLLERIWDVGPESTATRAAVESQGWDPETPPPDFDLYW